MTPIDYSSLDPDKIADWAAPLGTLLLESTEALRGGDRARCDAVIRALGEFKDRNTFAPLDKIASDTMQELTGASLDAMVQSIGARTAQLQRITADIGKTSAGARADAASIRMEAVTRALDASTNAVKALTQLRDAVGNDASARELVKKLQELIDKTRVLHDELRKTPAKP